MPKESSVQSSVLEYLNSLKGCIAENVSGNSSQSGRADINGCFRRRAFRIELKVPDRGNTPTKKQLYELLRWQKAGAIVMVAYSLDNVKTIFTNNGLLWRDGWQEDIGGGLTAFMCCDKRDIRIEWMLKDMEDFDE